MLPLERRNRIKELILERHSVKTSELSKEIGVSEMTIHRDLKPLVNEGVVIKTFGGVAVANKGESEISVSESCVFCKRKVSEHMAFHLFLANNKMETACCAHCGLLRIRQIGDKVIQSICSDFLKNTTISAPLAWYVMDTSIQMGCCQPQVLTFELKEHADKFIKGFGGNVYSYREAIDVIFQKMSGDNQCCHKHF